MSVPGCTNRSYEYFCDKVHILFDRRGELINLLLHNLKPARCLHYLIPERETPYTAILRRTTIRDAIRKKE